jgi:hypothetical protein
MQVIEHNNLPKIDELSKPLLEALGKMYVQEFFAEKRVVFEAYKYIGCFKGRKTLNMIYEDCSGFVSKISIAECFTKHKWKIGKSKRKEKEFIDLFGPQM